MNKILITGFGRFGDYQENITEALSREVSTLPNYSLEYLIFPVRIFSNGAHNYGEQVISRAQEIGARAIISLGMASDVLGVRIESRAMNWVENEKYCLESESAKLLDSSLPAKHYLSVDLSRWDLNNAFKCWQERNLVFESEISSQANFFCCNALMFRILQAMEKRNYFPPYIFLHVSCSYKSVEGVSGFDRNKHLISLAELRDILAILVGCLR